MLGQHWVGAVPMCSAGLGVELHGLQMTINKASYKQYITVYFHLCYKIFLQLEMYAGLLVINDPPISQQ